MTWDGWAMNTTPSVCEIIRFGAQCLELESTPVWMRRDVFSNKFFFSDLHEFAIPRTSDSPHMDEKICSRTNSFIQALHHLCG